MKQPDITPRDLERLAKWLGWKHLNRGPLWQLRDGSYHRLVWLTTREGAMWMLERLEKNYRPYLICREDGWRCDLCGMTEAPVAPTPALAVAKAALLAAEAEKASKR